MVLLPAFTLTVNVLVTHVVQAPVPSNDGDCTVDPFTARLAGLAVVVPLANRIPNVAVPAAAAFTVNWTKPLVALLPLQNPLPEKPVWLYSMTPSHVDGDVSAS